MFRAAWFLKVGFSISICICASGLLDILKITQNSQGSFLSIQLLRMHHIALRIFKYSFYFLQITSAYQNAISEGKMKKKSSLDASQGSCLIFSGILGIGIDPSSCCEHTLWFCCPVALELQRVSKYGPQLFLADRNCSSNLRKKQKNKRKKRRILQQSQIYFRTK